MSKYERKLGTSAAGPWHGELIAENTRILLMRKKSAYKKRISPTPTRTSSHLPRFTISARIFRRFVLRGRRPGREWECGREGLEAGSLLGFTRET